MDNLETFLFYTTYNSENNKCMKTIQAPIISINNYNIDEPILTVHSYINSLGKMNLNKEEASLLLIELYKFIESK